MGVIATLKKVLKEDKVDIVILDEINNALRYDLLTVKEVIDLIDMKGDKTELILTGRGDASGNIR